MADVNDMDLTRDYADHHSEPAFAELVGRHINLVYSVALRFTGNSADAQDVVQAVFVIFAKKPRAYAKELLSPVGCMKPPGSLPGNFCGAKPDNKSASKRLTCNPP